MTFEDRGKSLYYTTRSNFLTALALSDYVLARVTLLLYFGTQVMVTVDIDKVKCGIIIINMRTYSLRWAPAFKKCFVFCHDLSVSSKVMHIINPHTRSTTRHFPSECVYFRSWTRRLILSHIQDTYMSPTCTHTKCYTVSQWWLLQSNYTNVMGQSEQHSLVYKSENNVHLSLSKLKINTEGVAVMYMWLYNSFVRALHVLHERTIE